MKGLIRWLRFQRQMIYLDRLIEDEKRYIKWMLEDFDHIVEKDYLNDLKLRMENLNNRRLKNGIN